MWSALIDTLFPKLCVHCKDALFTHEEYLCANCQMRLEYLSEPTSQALLAHRLYGKMVYSDARALLLFTQSSISQSLLHHLKYKNKPTIGEWLAEVIYQRWENTSFFDAIDAIVYVPIHPKRVRERGYNQLTLFARRLAQRFQKECIEQAIIRTRYTQTQSKKTKEERHYAKEVFQIAHRERLEGKHILLIDDIITTGNTMMEIGRKINEIPHTNCSVLAIAVVE